ncbi:MAG: GspE/PulE family protein [Dehalococcoidales bacterium]|nr:GspE/PulE family protein [Dehalococcoidales bacterium]
MTPNTPLEEKRSRLRNFLPQPQALSMIPEAVARKYMAVPLEIVNNVLLVAMANPADIFALEALASQTQMRIEPELASAEEIQNAIDFNYQSYAEIEKHISNISLPDEAIDESVKIDAVNDAPVVQALSLIINEAVKARASDIHLQPDEDHLNVRYRIDGTLHDTLTLPLATALPLVSRIKILANMNIADHHRPQDGQFSVKTKRLRSIDIRVASIPTVCGEMVVMRLLDKSRTTVPLTELGFLPECLTKYQEMLKAPYGMILASGPTGAGKTTTLYASVNTLDCKGKNIITIEDPVEYRFKHINQAQVNTRAGLTFASGLRSILRLDPNIILVGEIRDSETAGIAVQSALTGHLVLSSIHANDSVSVVLRLTDLGIEPFLVASALIGVIAQRMVRRVCPDCARLVDAPSAEQMAYTKETGEKRTQFLYGSGCRLCANTGYQGRVGIFEILTMSEGIRAMLLGNITAAQVRAQAIKEGMVPLIKDGMLKVKSGITTPSEVLRQAYSVD